MGFPWFVALACLALSACQVGGVVRIGDGNTRIAIGIEDSIHNPTNADELLSIASTGAEPRVEVNDRTVRLVGAVSARIDRRSQSPQLPTPTGSDIAYLIDPQTETLLGVNVEALGGQGNGLDAAAFGIWLSEIRIVDQAYSSERTGAFLFGRSTRSRDMPGFGRADYFGFVTAAERQVDGASLLVDGPGRLTADFARRRVEGRFDLDSAEGAWGRLDIDGNHFRGATATSSRGHRGTVAGIFIGPDADEVGGVLDLQDDEGSTLIGAFGARFRD